MVLSKSDRAVVDAAVARADVLGSDPNYTVAAAAMDTTGRIYQAVNVFHFTGGPCAELVVLGVAAAADAGPLLTVAAAGDGGRGVIAPCGRCRQVLFDLHPDVHVVVDGPQGLDVRPIRSLLPHAYEGPGGKARRIIRFDGRYFDAIATGAKVVTVRFEDRVEVGPALFVFDDDSAYRTLDAVITEVVRCAVDELTPEQVHLDPGSSIADYIAGLRDRYSDITANSSVEVATFSVGGDF